MMANGGPIDDGLSPNHSEGKLAQTNTHTEDKTNITQTNSPWTNDKYTATLNGINRLLLNLINDRCIFHLIVRQQLKPMKPFTNWAMNEGELFYS